MTAPPKLSIADTLKALLDDPSKAKSLQILSGNRDNIIKASKYVGSKLSPDVLKMTSVAAAGPHDMVTAATSVVESENWAMEANLP